MVIFGGALLHGIWTGWEPIGPGILVTLGFLMVVSWVLQYAVTAFGAKKYGASNWGVLGAVIGMFFGLLVPIPGLLIGPFLGALTFELAARWIREQRSDEPKAIDGKSVAKASMGAAVGAIVGLMAELGIALLMDGLIVTAFVIALF
jgi:uncharacterized protein YqgC (DUF456 family)